MKKLILVLLLPLTTLMAVDYTMTKEGLFANTAAQSPTPGDTPAPGTDSGKTNPYLEPVNLPKCDANNPEVQFIRSNADWSKINSSSKRIFCVSPGDYRSLRNIKITASGTAEKRRYIILNNGNDIHPGKLNQEELANYTLRVNGSYWTIDRFSAFNTQVTDAIILKGINNIVNRGFTNNYSRAVKIENMAHNNTIQNCRFQNMKPAAMDDDQVSINIIAWGLASYEIKNTKIINNEIVTSNDGIQTTRSPINGSSLYQQGNCEGTIIDGNDIWQDHSTMGTATGENAIDIKVGSDNPENPILITNNHIWNWDAEQAGYHMGTAIVLHYNPKNVKINNNVIFDSAEAINTGSAGETGFSNGMIDGEIANNLIYNMFQDGVASNCIRATSILNTNIHNNIFVKCSSIKGRFVGNLGGSLFTNNIYVDFTGKDFYLGDNVSTFNKSVLTTITGIGYTEDYTFITDNFTNNPRIIRLNNALKAK